MRLRIGVTIAAAAILCGCFNLPKFGMAQEVERNRLKRATSINPQNAHAWFALGKSALDAGNFDEAERHFLAATKANPKLEEAWLGLGVARLEDNDPKGAEEAYRRVLALDPNIVEAHEGLATVELERRNLDGAVGHANRALALDPGAKQAIRVLGEVHYIRGDYAGALAIWDRISTEGGDGARRDPFQDDLRQYVEKYGSR